jgi:hypothetical protein
LQATDEAKKIFKEYEKQNYFSLVELVRKKNNEEEIAFKGRLIFAILKISGLLTLAEKKFIVDETEMRNAILIGKYFERNISKLLEDELTEKSEFQIKEEKVYRIIRESGEIQRSELMRKKVCATTKELDLVIQNLSEKEMIESVDIYNKMNRKTTKIYKVRKE